jgi:hypothetical protein
MDLRSALSPELDPLWREVHRRLSSGRAVSRVRVGPLRDGGREALADLLGLSRLPGEYAVVSLSQLDGALRDAVGAEAREVVTELVGPVGDQAGDRVRAETKRAELWAWVQSHPVIVAQPVLTDWVAFVRRAGLVGGSVARTRDELDRALRVLAELPAAGVPLPVVADRVLDDPHALDDGTRCATLVQRALAVIYQVPAAADAHDRRSLWERAGVTGDDLSSLEFAAGLRTSHDRCRRGRGPHAAPAPLGRLDPRSAARGLGVREPERAVPRAGQVRRGLPTGRVCLRMAEWRGNPAAARIGHRGIAPVVPRRLRR